MTVLVLKHFSFLLYSRLYVCNYLVYVLTFNRHQRPWDGAEETLTDTVFLCVGLNLSDSSQWKASVNTQPCFAHWVLTKLLFKWSNRAAWDLYVYQCVFTWMSAKSKDAGFEPLLSTGSIISTNKPIIVVLFFLVYTCVFASASQWGHEWNAGEDVTCMVLNQRWYMVKVKQHQIFIDKYVEQKSLQWRNQRKLNSIDPLYLLMFSR